MLSVHHCFSKCSATRILNKGMSLLGVDCIRLFTTFFSLLFSSFCCCCCYIKWIKVSNQNENERALDKVNELRLAACTSITVILFNQRVKKSITETTMAHLLTFALLPKRLSYIFQSISIDSVMFKGQFRQILFTKLQFLGYYMNICIRRVHSIIFFFCDSNRIIC